MATNFEELLKENPELAEAVRSEITAKAAEDMKKQSQKAVEDERNRLAEIDKIASQCSPELVKKAKYGDEHITAQELAYKVLLDSAENGRTFLRDLNEDAQNSQTGKVSSAVPPELDELIESDAKQMAKAEAQLKEFFDRVGDDV